MQSILENFFSTDSKIVYNNYVAENLTADQAIAYIQNLSYTLTQKIKEYSIGNKQDEIIKNLTFSVGPLDVIANFEVWRPQALKDACDVLANAKRDLLSDI